MSSLFTSMQVFLKSGLISDLNVLKVKPRGHVFYFIRNVSAVARCALGSGVDAHYDYAPFGAGCVPKRFFIFFVPARCLQNSFCRFF